MISYLNTNIFSQTQTIYKKNLKEENDLNLILDLMFIKVRKLIRKQYFFFATRCLYMENFLFKISAIGDPIVTKKFYTKNFKFFKISISSENIYLLEKQLRLSIFKPKH